MASGGFENSVTGRKVVCLGIPWEVDTEGLRDYMTKFGQIEDIVVMKDRATGRSRGFGYVTFSTVDEAERMLSQEHIIRDRTLVVKIATPKEEMKPKVTETRIFVAKIPADVDDDQFRSYFEQFGKIVDAYMPKEQGGGRVHRGMGFITYDHPSGVEKAISEKHELGGAEVTVDIARPKDDSRGRAGPYGGPARYDPMPRGGYGDYDRGPPAYSARDPYGARDYYGARTGGYGARDPYDTGDPYDSRGYGGARDYRAPSAYRDEPRAPGSYGAPPPSRNIADLKTSAAKIFIGKLPLEATTQDLRNHFGVFGEIEDVYIPREPNKSTHKGFGFVTFAEESVATFVASRPHTIMGKPVAVDRATPPVGGDAGYGSSRGMARSSGYGNGGGGPVRGSSGPPMGAPGASYYGAAPVDPYYSSPSSYQAFGQYGDYAAPGTDSRVPGSDYRTRDAAARYRPY